MSDQAESALAQAFASEAKMAARHAVFAQRADQEGQPHLGRLLLALAESENVHARRYLRLMRGKIGNTEDNLEQAFSQELPKAISEYEGLISLAEQEGSQAVATALSQSRESLRRLAELYHQNKAANAPSYHVCQVCGYAAPDRAPERCPICGAVSSKFRELE
jgi:rubrerythrin